jgi:hypothetical protein
VQPDSEIPSFKGEAEAGSLPPPLPSENRNSGSLRQLLVVLLSLCLGLFLLDAVVSLIDDSLILFFDTHVLTGIRGTLFLFSLLAAIVIYGLMGLTPMIPKRLFLPLTLFGPVAELAVILVAIYFYSRLQQFAWVLSFCQVILGLSILRWAQAGFQFRWPLVAEDRLGGRRFSWRNLLMFLLGNVFVLIPAVIAYLVLCAALAVDHFSDGFMALRPEGLKVQVRKYVRNDGKTIQLVPMSHVGEPDFYQKLSQSFPTNSILLMEGVSDDRNLLTNKISYQRMAKSLGVAEQQTEFKPSRTQMVRADVDVEQFTTNTIDFLNLVTLIHSKGLNAGTIQMLMQYSEPSYFHDQLFDDILRKRNRHLLEEIQVWLSQSENIIVPWGAAHMPEIAKGIQKSGFRVVETEDHVAIRFHSSGHKNENVGKGL